MATGPRLVARETPANFRDFARLYFGASKQPEFRRYGGALLWALYPLGVLAAYLHARRYGVPGLILVERGDRLLAGCMITPSGWLTNGIAQGEPAEKRAAMRLLYVSLARYLTRTSHRCVTARIDASNDAMVQGMHRLGFRDDGTPCYIVTLPLGALTMSWYAKSPPAQGWLQVDKHLEVRWLRGRVLETEQPGADNGHLQPEPRLSSLGVVNNRRIAARKRP